MPQYKVLVLNADGFSAAAILRCLVLSRFDVCVTASESNRLPRCRAHSRIALPDAAEKAFASVLENILYEQGIDLILLGDPTRLCDIAAALAGASRPLKQRIVLHPLDFVQCFTDRYDTANWLSEHNLTQYAIPTSLSREYREVERMFRTPFYVRHRYAPNRRSGVMVQDQGCFQDEAQSLGEDMVTQKRISSDDMLFSALVFGSGDGVFCNGMCIRRARSDRCETVLSNPDIRKATLLVTGVAKPIGPAEFLFRLQYGVPHLLQLNPCITPSAFAYAKLGFNIVDMCIEYYIFKQRPHKVPVSVGQAPLSGNEWIAV